MQAYFKTSVLVSMEIVDGLFVVNIPYGHERYSKKLPDGKLNIGVPGSLRELTASDLGRSWFNSLIKTMPS